LKVASWFQRRRERRRRRQRAEEVMSWFFLPIIVLISFFLGSLIWDQVSDPARTLIKAVASGDLLR